MKNNKFQIFVLIFGVLSTIIFIIFFSRQIFFYQYEPEYYENWFYHSQWNIPQSTRGISDGEIYKFVGYRLAVGENPFNINYETPPLVKYLYGLAEMYIGNPYWVSIFIYLASILTILLIAKQLFKDIKLSLWVVLLFVTTPLVATQLRETMLDLPLMFFYLVHTLFFVKFIINKKIINLLAAGTFLGLAAGTKIGIYTPLATVLGIILILFLPLKLPKKISDNVLYIGAVCSGFVFSYFMYFIKHPNPLPWLRLLFDKSIVFYLNSTIEADYLNQWKTIFLNTYQGWWQARKINVGDWSFILPLGVIAALIVFVISVKQKKSEWSYISGLCIVFLTVNTIIPFWPRYLIPLIPLFVLLIVYLFKKTTVVILLLVILNLPFLVGTLTAEDISGNSEATARFISTRAYRELYRSINLDQRKTIPENQFINYNEDFMQQIGVRKISMKLNGTQKTNNGFSASYDLKYITKYGEINSKPVFEYIKVNNQPKLVWKWDYLWPGYDPNNKIIIEEDTIPFLHAVNSSGAVVLKRGEWKTVYIIPRLMYDWAKVLNELALLTGKSSLEVERQLQSVIPDKFPRFVGYLTQKYGQEGITKALSIPGTSLEDIDYALLSPSVIIPGHPETYEYPISALTDLQRNKPELFYIQAKIYFENSNGKKVELPLPKAQDQNVVAPI